MTASRFPVFWKDVRSLLKPMGAFLALQAVYTGGFLLVFRYFDGVWPPFTAFGEVTLLAAVALGQIFGLVAAGYVFAEEKTSGTDVFLRRLPASRTRITLEKLAAGLTVLTLLLLIQVALHVMALPWGGLWPTEFPLGILDEFMSWMVTPAAVIASLIVYYFGSYVVGVLVSLFTPQALVIVVVGYGIETVVYGFAMMGVDDGLFISWEMALLNLIMYAPLILVPLLVIVPGSRFRIPGAASLLAPGRAPVLGLVWKSVTENSALQVLSLAFLLGALISPLDLDSTLVGGGALLLLVALGTASYSPVEKRGLDCVLYQHPVPRHHLFLAKTGAAALPVLAVAAGVLVFWGQRAPTEVVTVLAYSAFAYACAVLMTLTFERSVIALLATVSLVISTLLLPFGALAFLDSVADLDVGMRGVRVRFWPDGVSGAATAVEYLGLAVPSMLLAAGCMWAAWRMATDPAVLTGSPRYRLRASGRLYAAVAAVSFVVTILWWSEPLAVIG